MTLTLVIIVLLVMGVVFVNGWTDAPNAIATVISTRSMKPQSAVYMAAVFNFLGVLVMAFLSKEVAFTISKMVSFGSGQEALVALAAALVAIIVWAVAAWYFGIPTSESHALIAGLTGAAMATGGGFAAINGAEWVKVLYGLGISTIIGFSAGFIITKVTEYSCRGLNRRKADRFFGKAQVVTGAMMAFLHGAQDGLKFMGVLMLGVFLAEGKAIPASFDINPWILVISSAVMGIGTSVGGYRIIKAVGMDMVKLEKHQGFLADFAASLCLLGTTIAGIPVSTTHTKTTAVMGVGASKRLSIVNWGIVKDMVLAWVLTFPICGLIGYGMAFLFNWIF